MDLYLMDLCTQWGDIDQLLIKLQELKSPYGVYLRLVLF